MMFLYVREASIIDFFPLHTRTRPIIIRLPERCWKGWEANSRCTSLWGEFRCVAAPPPLPGRPFSESWRERGREGGRNEETLDANGERSNVAGKISSGEILAAGCFCIETWPFFLFFFFSSPSFYLFLSLPLVPRSTKTLGKIDTERCESSRENASKEASVSNRGSPLFPQIF